MKKDMTPVKKQHHSAPVVRAHNHYDPFQILRGGINSLFEDFMSGGAFDRPFAPVKFGGEVFSPSFDVAETADAVRVTAELPGMTVKDIDVSIDSGSLVISGEKKEEHETKEKNMHVSERVYGSFRREFPLPNGFDEAKIKAGFSKGVLEIVLPKTEQAKSKGKKIDVKGD
jgi:HSP20 family protein